MMNQSNFNYAKVYDFSGGVFKEGFVDHWESAFSGNMIDLSFTDGSILKVPVQYVFLFNKNSADVQ